MYSIELMPKALKELKGLPKPELWKIIKKLHNLENGLTGDIKNLLTSAQNTDYALEIIEYFLK